MDAPGGEEVAIADQQNQTQDGNKAAEEDHQVDQITTADRQTAVREFVDFTEYLPSDISRTLNILQKMDLAYESHKTELERAAIAMSGAVPLEALTNGPTIIPVPSQLAIEHPESSSQHQHQEQQQPEQTDSNLPAPVSASTPPPPPPAATPAVPDAAAPIPESKPDADTQLTNGTDSTPAPSLTVASLFGPPGKILLPNNEYMRMRVNMSQELNRALKAREQALAEAEKMGLMSP
ncbi:hypothetical protein BJ508DRAFT_3695 [Ascobolus immersus RN42]|uniref:Inhibitor of growth protein N-terminal histone-binding domain-containing protein n=1 Tax=Ascobolus immersus RN42 TaxID=1160509 RepID=A0A3N4IS12_ASCIM|nr:hypothetical protein BJ508DRAFT_3695 [Ascobolus immersus RN42]